VKASEQQHAASNAHSLLQEQRHARDFVDQLLTAGTGCVALKRADSGSETHGDGS